MKRKCLVCGSGILEEIEDIKLEIEGYIFILKGHRCSNCKEEFPLEEETKRAIEVSKRLCAWSEPLS